MILFARELGGWRVEASDLQFGYLGEFGLPPTISLQPVGPERYGLFIPAFFGSTGVALNSITIVIPRGGAFLKVFEEQIAGSSDYGCSGTAAEERVNECVEYDGAFDLAPDSHGEYYDLLLTRRVYRSFSNKDPVNTTVTRYRFNGMNYAPVGKPSTAALKSPN
ncbi:MAG TPA: hypothetical protein VE077_16140 [Candidatus Methylomirabilis sp.]|nr:hypothetical protein [Candidatus Methylomirabilis sp.]